ncbi:hypothetical protein [Streptomyces sp. Tue6028]|uniref:hypothetical protein n=1 Tax=Streptomyces sp. Tue6028 TaxID=2036037 RepID=UPI003D7629F5
MPYSEIAKMQPKVIEGEKGERYFSWRDLGGSGGDSGGSGGDSGGGSYAVTPGYHYVPELGVAIPNGFAYDPSAGAIVLPPQATIYVRVNSGVATPVGGGGDAGAGPDVAPAPSAHTPGMVTTRWPEPSYVPPDGSIWESIGLPSAGWVHLGRTELIHPKNTGTVPILLVPIDAWGHELYPGIILFPGESLDWYRPDAGISDIWGSAIYGSTAEARARGARAEVTYLLPIPPSI